ncbi:hypothetical protein SH501x_003167 [Pirellulaceae bacterium SH501]
MRIFRKWYFSPINLSVVVWLMLANVYGYQEEPDTDPLTTPEASGDIDQQPFSQFEFSYLSQLDDNGFGISSLDLRRSLILGYEDITPLTLTPGFVFHMWSGPSDLDLPSRVYDLSVDFEWKPWESDKSSLLVGATPGLYGDFEFIDSKTFQWSGWIAGTRQLNSKWLAMGGVAYVRQLESNWLPIGGVIWQPNESTRIDLVFPRPRIVRNIKTTETGTISWYITGHYDGGAWSVEDTPSSNVLVSYSDLRLLTGLEGNRAGEIRWRAEFGYAFSREISIDRVSISNPSDGLIFECSLAY